MVLDRYVCRMFVSGMTLYDYVELNKCHEPFVFGFTSSRYCLCFCALQLLWGAYVD